MPVEYRFNVTRTLLAWAWRYVFEAAALVFVVVTQVEIWSQTYDDRTRIAAVGLLTVGALLFRRRAPFVAPLVTAAGVLALTFLDARGAYDVNTMFFVLLLGTWAAGLLLDNRQAATAFAAVLVGGWVVLLRAPELPWTEALWLTLPLTGSFAISAASARRGERVRVAEERARHLEAEAERALQDERSRITRELHDVLAHSVSVMTVQASAVRRLLTPEQEREREALRTVEETGRQALSEMRRMLGIMRIEEEVPSLAPQPGLKTLPALVEQVRQSGLPVELTVEGEPVQLAAGVDLSAYRIVQEALTNTLKHAGRPAHAWVAVRYVGDDVEIEVADDGRNDGVSDGTGHGLVGMRERVAICGGELQSGPRPGGGFCISARLPVAGSTA
jgi:signal transduction histidine kinase